MRIFVTGAAGFIGSHLVQTRAQILTEGRSFTRAESAD
jgi:nucleoside-diphosphate-sugar epimerase